MPVRFRLCGQDQPTGYRGGWTENLSSGGLQLRCNPVESVGNETKIRAQLRLDDERWVNATGKVVWMESSPSDESQLLGIRFVDLDQVERDTLSDFVEPRHSK